MKQCFVKDNAGGGGQVEAADLAGRYVDGPRKSRRPRTGWSGRADGSNSRTHRWRPTPDGRQATLDLDSGRQASTTRLDTLSRDHHGPRAILNTLERLAGVYRSECVRVRQDLGIAESQLRDYQARLGKPFLHDAYLSELTSLRDQLKAGLSATAQMQDDDAGPSVSELAEKIKALKAAHSIEATPQRVRQKQSTAEEPVTARIRRRTGPVSASDPAIQPDAASPAGETMPPAAGENSDNKPQMTFQERIAMERERQRKDQEPNLP